MDILKRVYRFLSSMKTGLTLLVLVGLASVLGSSFLPDTFYDTSVFKFLLFFLLVNMFFCTANRLILFRSGFQMKVKRGWRKHVGGLLLHLGIVLILVGMIANMYFGQSGHLYIHTGDTVTIADQISVKKPFSLHLDQFEVEYNQDGSPSQYYSHVTILEEGNAVDKAKISVNHPLKHNGAKMYQQSYGHLMKANYVNKTGEKVEELVVEGNMLELQGTERTVKVFRYLPNYDPALGMVSKTIRPDNPRIVFSVYENDSMLGVGAAKFDEDVEIDEGVHLVFKGVEPYTVLRVKSDPGLPLTGVGGMMFIIGVSFALLAKPARGKE